MTPFSQLLLFDVALAVAAVVLAFRGHLKVELKRPAQQRPQQADSATVTIPSRRTEPPGQVDA